MWLPLVSWFAQNRAMTSSISESKGGKAAAATLSKLERAVADGDHAAGYALAQAYLYGMGIARVDLKKGAAQLQSCVERKVPCAASWLAVCHWFGMGVAVDHARRDALLQIELATDPFAQLIWANVRPAAKDVSADADAAERAAAVKAALPKIVTLAAAGDARALYEMGLAHLFGLPGNVKADAAEAVSYFLQGAALGHADAQFRLAHALRSGSGIDKDQKAAVRMMNESAAQGFPVSLLAAAEWALEDAAGLFEQAGAALLASGSSAQGEAAALRAKAVRALLPGVEGKH